MSPEQKLSNRMGAIHKIFRRPFHIESPSFTLDLKLTVDNEVDNDRVIHLIRDEGSVPVARCQWLARATSLQSRVGPGTERIQVYV